MSRGIFYVASHTPLHVFGRALKHGQYDPRTASPTIGRADSAAACSRDVDSYSSHPISRRGVEEAAPAGDLAVLYREYMRPRCLKRLAGLARGRALPVDLLGDQFQDLCHITSTERLIGLLHNGGRCSHVHLPIGMAERCLHMYTLGVLVWLFCVCFVFCCVFLVSVCCSFLCV